MVAPNDDRRMLISHKEAAKQLGISPRTLWAMQSRGEIPVIKVGKLLRYTNEDLQEYVKKKRIRR